MIDQKARERLTQENRLKGVIEGIGSQIAGALSKNGQPQPKDSSVDFTIGLKEQTDPKEVELLDKLGKGLVVIYKAIKGIKVQLPKIFKVEGIVDIGEMPSIEVSNLEILSKYFTNLEGKIAQLSKAINMVSTQQPYKIEIPKTEFPKISMTEVTAAIKDLEKVMKKSGSQEDLTDALFKIEQGINSLVEKPTMTPTPVTNINLNPLQGIAKSTTTTVSTTLTQLPGYGQLVNRRSLQIYNNSTTITLYIGGSDVTTSNGMVVPPTSYSPSIDAGDNMIIYGVTSSSTVDARVIEVSKTNVVVVGTSDSNN